MCLLLTNVIFFLSKEPKNQVTTKLPQRSSVICLSDSEDDDPKLKSFISPPKIKKTEQTRPVPDDIIFQINEGSSRDSWRSASSIEASPVKPTRNYTSQRSATIHHEQTIDDIYAKYSTPPKDDEAPKEAIRLSQASKVDLSDRLNADDRYVNASRDLEAMVNGIKDRATDSCGFFRVNGNPEEKEDKAPPVVVVEVKKPQKFRLIVPTKRLSLGSSNAPLLSSESENSQKVLPLKPIERSITKEPERPKIKDFSMFDEFMFNSSTTRSPPKVKPRKGNSPTRIKPDLKPLDNKFPNSKPFDKSVPTISKILRLPSTTITGPSSESLAQNTKDTPPPIRKKFVFQSASRSKVDDQVNFSFEDKPNENPSPEHKKSPEILQNIQNASIRMSIDGEKSQPLSQSTDGKSKSPRKPSQHSKSPKQPSQSSNRDLKAVSSVEKTDPKNNFTDDVPKKQLKFVPQVLKSRLSVSKIPSETITIKPTITETANNKSPSEMILRDFADADSFREQIAPTAARSIDFGTNKCVPDKSDEFDDLINGTVLTGFEGLKEFIHKISSANELRAPSTVSS